MNLFLNVIIMFFLATFVSKADNYIFTPINVSHGLSDNQIRYILQLTDGRMVFTTSGNLNIYDGSHFKYIHRTDEHIYELKKYNGFYRIYQEGDSILWIKDTHKLTCLNLHQEKYITDLDLYLKSRKIEMSVDDLFVDSAHHLWGLSSGKLWRNNTDEIFDIIDNNGNLQDLATDMNNLYLFYDTGEIICYELQTKKIRYKIAAYHKNEEIVFKNTSLVIAENNGFYQLRNGTKGGFFFFDKQKLVWTKILETDYVLNTLVIKDEIAYISCSTGIWVVNCRSGEKEYLPRLKTVEGDSIDTEISTLFYDRQNGFWLGTVDQGLLYCHPARYKFRHIGRSYFLKNSTKNIIVQSFAEDEVGNIYVKCNFEIYSYNPANKNSVLTIISPSELPQYVEDKLNLKISHTYEDSRGWRWVGTKDGLKLLKPGEEKGEIFYTKDGLSNNFVHAILEDKNNNLWITTSYGISKAVVDSVNGKVRFMNFNIYDGTLNGEYSDGAAFESKNGTLFFGGINGFNVLDPSRLEEEKVILKPVFTNFFLHGDPIEVGKEYDGRVVINQSTPYTTEIELSYKQNFLTFEFSAVNYLNPSQTRYRYQLEGLDANWHETHTGGQYLRANGVLRASYTNLPHGEYVFKVIASSNGDQWDSGVAKIKIIIYAPWWKTSTAYVLYVLFFIISVCLGIWLFINFTRKKHDRQYKEEILLLRIRSLIDQNKLLEEEKEFFYSKKDQVSRITENDNNMSTADADFLSRAIEKVEMNLNIPNYSVEMLSRDLCMDRTGLYRKLIAILDKSPSHFIRNIRLQKAAQLILHGKLSIAEIAEEVGFNSSSYLSKCFQEVYGCRPSEYAEKTKKSEISD